MRRFLSSAAGAIALIAVIGALSACSSSSKSSSASTAPVSSGTASTTSAAALTIKNFAFSPTPLTARVGATITVTNNDTTDHTVTDSGGAFDTGHISPGTSKTFTVSKPGTYHYHCSIHSFMMGEIKVG